MKINDNLLVFLILTGFFSFISSFISFLLGRLFMCGFTLSMDMDTGAFCSISKINMVVSGVVNLLMVSLYLTRISALAGKHEKKSWFLGNFGWKKELKSLFLVCCYLLFWIVIGCLSVVLIYRHPQPDWLTEFGFFSACSLGIVCAVILLVNFCGFLHFLHGGRLSFMKKTFWPTFDEVFKIIFWFFIYMVIFVFLFNDVFRYFVTKLSLSSVAVSEFCLYFLLFLSVAVIYFSYEYQEKELFVDEK